MTLAAILFPGLYASATPSPAVSPQPAHLPTVRLEDVVAIPSKAAEDPKMVEQAKRAVQQRVEEEARIKAAEAERQKQIQEFEALKQRVQAALVASTNPGSYVSGQCTWYVASRRQVPPYWGNAVQWLANAQASGWQTGPTPVVGAIAWTALGPYGHVAIVEAVQGSQVLIAEMNALYGPYRVDERWVSARSFFYIY